MKNKQLNRDRKRKSRHSNSMTTKIFGEGKVSQKALAKKRDLKSVPVLVE